MTLAELIAIIEDLHRRAPVTAARYPDLTSSELRATWVAWLSQYHTAGAYNRKRPGSSPREAYVRLQSPSMLLWLCEQLGATRRELEAAADAAAMHANKSASAAALRSVIPWERAAELAERAKTTRDGSDDDRAQSAAPKEGATERARRKTKAESTRVAAPTVTIDTPAELRAFIVPLPEAHPRTDQFSAEWRSLRRKGDSESQKERKDVWYSTQHEHWLGWLRGYDGAGAYGREDWNRSASFVYNHIVNPQMLIYLAEVLGFEEALIAKACRAALVPGAKMMAMSGAIRKVFPWEIIEAALVARANASAVRARHGTRAHHPRRG